MAGLVASNVRPTSDDRYTAGPKAGWLDPTRTVPEAGSTETAYTSSIGKAGGSQAQVSRTPSDLPMNNPLRVPANNTDSDRFLRTSR